VDAEPDNKEYNNQFMCTSSYSAEALHQRQNTVTLNLIRDSILRNKTIISLLPQNRTIISLLPQNRTIISLLPQNRTSISLLPQNRTIISLLPQNRTIISLLPQDSLKIAE